MFAEIVGNGGAREAKNIVHVLLGVQRRWCWGHALHELQWLIAWSPSAYPAWLRTNRVCLRCCCSRCCAVTVCLMVKSRWYTLVCQLVCCSFRERVNIIVVCWLCVSIWLCALLVWLCVWVITFVSEWFSVNLIVCWVLLVCLFVCCCSSMFMLFSLGVECRLQGIVSLMWVWHRWSSISFVVFYRFCKHHCCIQIVHYFPHGRAPERLAEDCCDWVIEGQFDCVLNVACVHRVVVCWCSFIFKLFCHWFGCNFRVVLSLMWVWHCW